jgi:glycosyltransferase involved in cell wall biosynthesis
MKLINTTYNTIRVPDIDLLIPYESDTEFEIHPDLLKRSKSLRQLIINRQLDVASYDAKEKIEASVMFLRSQHDGKTDVKQPEVELVRCDRDGCHVKFHGIFFDAGGYAKVNRNIVRGLEKRGFYVQAESKSTIRQIEGSEISDIQRLTGHRISGNYVQIDSVIPSLSEMKRTRAKYHILYTTLEASTVPDEFVQCANRYDEIWLTSTWSANVMRKYLSQKPIRVMPPGVNPSLYKEGGHRFDFRPNIKQFVFLSVFSWNYRKGWDVLLSSYFDEFSSNDDVSLLIASRYQFGDTRAHKNKIKEDIEKVMEQFPNKDLPHVVRYSQVIPEDQMPHLYRAAHCFVLPSRGEGICLPPMEASLCGLPVITTNWSGQTEYVKPENSYLIDIDRLEVVKRGVMRIHYWDGHEFPALTDEKVRKQLKQCMRNVYENYEQARGRNKQLQELIHKDFTWDRSVDKITVRLKEIFEQIKE